jgi:uncharacterized membrane protein
MKKQNLQFTNYAILFLLLLNLFFIAFIIYQENTSSGVCLVGHTCESVTTSEYGTLFGMIKVSHFGFASFLMLLLIYVLVLMKKLNYPSFLAANYIGLFFSIYFISVQAFVLKMFCSNCMVVDSVTILLCITATIEYFRRK